MELQIKIQDAIKKIDCNENETILQILQQNKIYLSAICAGKGTCGKCKIKVVKGNLPITKADREKLTEKELKDGIRLACKCYVKEPLVIELCTINEEQMFIQGVQVEGQQRSRIHKLEDRSFLAIDIGTTTIAMALVDLENGNILDTYTTLNRQQVYGADVISRLSAANEGKLMELKKLVEEDVWKGILKLTEKYQLDNIEEQDLQGVFKKIVIVGNTTMIHLLMGYSCESLGKYPFRSEHLEKQQRQLEEVISNSKGTKLAKIPITILPGISAFVGSDISSGLLVCPNFKTDKLSLLLDLGTNGEMVLGNRRRRISASSAAGPAFEGGNMLCGTGSVSGAISQVKIQNRRAVIRTIGGIYPPVGICGTGIISAMAELKRNKIIDEYGKLQTLFEKTGFPLWIGPKGERISVYQQDIRQFQLAKAAIRTALEQLMNTFGCQPKEIDTVYLAGGFGTQLSVKDAVETGIIPLNFEEKVKNIGNGALQGAIYYGLIEHKEEIIIWENIEGVILAEAENFQENYLNYLNFSL